MDVYPGTWGPPIDVTRLGSLTATAVRNALGSLRLHHMPLARLARRVAMHISENGYPTGPGRTPAMQTTAMRAAISAIRAAGRRYNVTDYRWFNLRDANSASGSFQDRYGLLYDDYTPKPASETLPRVDRDLQGSLTERRRPPPVQISTGPKCVSAPSTPATNAFPLRRRG